MSIYTDAGMNKKTGDYAWGCIVDQNGDDLIITHLSLFQDMKIEKETLPVGERMVIKVKFDDVKTQQNNGGELCALVGGLRIALTIELKIIYCDSELLVKWWSKGNVNSKTLAKMDENKKKFINELICLTKKFNEKGGKIVKISGSKNLADLGYHI